MSSTHTRRSLLIITTHPRRKFDGGRSPLTCCCSTRWLAAESMSSPMGSHEHSYAGRQPKPVFFLHISSAGGTSLCRWAQEQPCARVPACGANCNLNCEHPWDWKNVCPGLPACEPPAQPCRRPFKRGCDGLARFARRRNLTFLASETLLRERCFGHFSCAACGSHRTCLVTRTPRRASSTRATRLAPCSRATRLAPRCTVLAGT